MYQRFSKTYVCRILIVALSTGGTIWNSKVYAAGDAAAAAPDQIALEEVIVTAQKTQENLQKAPAAITALSGDQLANQGIVNVRGLEAVLPSVEIRPEGPVSQIFIRGVGNNIDVPFTEAGAAYNLNGVPLPRYASTSSFFDLADVEVLPGPQGTLYGGSAAGGVVNINMKKPAHNDAGQMSVEFGNYNLKHGFVAQNIAIGENLSVRATVDYQDHHGWFSNGTESDEATSARLSALYDPTNDISIYVWGNYFRDIGKPAGAVNSPLLDPSNPWYVPAINPITPNPFIPFPVPVDVNLVNKHFDIYTAGAQLDWQVGDVKITDIPGYAYVSTIYHRYDAYFPSSIGDFEHQFSNELRFSGAPSAALKWLGGVYYSHDNIYFPQTFFNVPILTVFQKNQSYATFGQFTYSITDRFRLTAGARYSHDQKTADGTSATDAGPIAPFAADYQWSHVDGKLGVEADIADQSMLYATIQTGYLPGGYSPHANTATFNNQIQPEKLLSYTAGIKNRFWDGKLELNDEAYYYDYKDYVVSTINLVTGAISTYSAKKARIYGDQLNVRLMPTQQDEIDVGVGLMSAQYTDFLIGTTSYDGYQLTDAPSVVGNLGLQHEFALGTGAKLTARAQTHYENGHWGQFNHITGSHQDAYTKTDLTLTYLSESGRWTVALWGKNLENKATIGATAASISPGPTAAFIDPPRTFGIRANLSWGGANSH
jgi:iron complex outermembrane recepter protein